jgi:hypothetical protein
MPAKLVLRPDFDAIGLRRLAKRCSDTRQTRRFHKKSIAVTRYAIVWDGTTGLVSKDDPRESLNNRSFSF